MGFCTSTKWLFKRHEIVFFCFVLLKEWFLVFPHHFSCESQHISPLSRKYLTFDNLDDILYTRQQIHCYPMFGDMKGISLLSGPDNDPYVWTNSML